MNRNRNSVVSIDIDVVLYPSGPAYEPIGYDNRGEAVWSTGPTDLNEAIELAQRICPISQIRVATGRRDGMDSPIYEPAPAVREIARIFEEEERLGE